VPFVTPSVTAPLLAEEMLADPGVAASLHARSSIRSLLSSLARAVPKRRGSGKEKRRISRLSGTGSNPATSCKIREATRRLPLRRNRSRLQLQMGR